MRERLQHLGGIHNRKRGSVRESERPIVVKKRGNACGAKGPYWKRASNEMDRDPLERMLDYGKSLYYEGEAVPTGQAGVNASANAQGESFQESRMSGLRRGGWGRQTRSQGWAIEAHTWKQVGEARHNLQPYYGGVNYAPLRKRAETAHTACHTYSSYRPQSSTLLRQFNASSQRYVALIVIQPI